MRALVNLFGRSPFAPLRLHMERVAACTNKLTSLFEALGSQETIELLAKEVSKLEHEADLTKNELRTSLKSSLFLPVDRLSLLEVLSLQDALADQAEDIAVLLTFRKMTLPNSIASFFPPFLEKNLESISAVYKVVEELQVLAESSFGGAEANKLRAMVHHVAYLEHEADLLQRPMLKSLFAHEEEFTFASFDLWVRIIGEVGQLSNLAEKLANRVLITMELK